MSFPIYSISGETADGAVSSSMIHKEIESMSFSGSVFQGVVIDHDMDSIELFFDIEPSTQEKSDVDTIVGSHNPNSLQAAKSIKISEIDRRTEELIGSGFLYDSTNFSLSLPAQAKMVGTHQVKDDPALVYPLRWNSKTDDGAYEIVDAADMHGFYLTALGTIRSYLDSGTALKDLVRAATTVPEVDAVVDTR